MAHSGWSKDSLESLDSTVYESGKVVEKTQIYYSQGSVYSGNKSSYIYLSGGKTLVGIYYLWNDSLSKWEPSTKDSIIYSTPFNINIYWSMSDDLHGFLKEFLYTYDNSSWKSAGNSSMLDSECNATTLVVSGNTLNDDNDSLEDYKIIMAFNSSVWSNDNLAETRGQVKNPDGEFYDIYKGVISENVKTTYVYHWDSNSKSPVFSYKDIKFTDSHKNDTLLLYCNLLVAYF